MSLRACRLGLMVLLVGLWMPNVAWAERVALVIGNGNYRSAGFLPNPLNDARLITDALRSVRFKVTQHQDLDKAAMERAILSFGREAQGAEVALVYFAGHGIQSEGKNFLVPVDAQLADDLALPIETVDIDVLLRATDGARARLIILDACRNNPLTAQMRMTQAGRSITRGLAPVSTGGGTLIAFSTSPGTIALDGDGRYSPFAESFAKALKQPGIEIRQVFTQVRREVLAKTAQRQMPWDNSSLLFDVYLAGVDLGSPEGQPLPRQEIAPSPAPAQVPQRFRIIISRGGRGGKYIDNRESGAVTGYSNFELRFPAAGFSHTQWLDEAWEDQVLELTAGRHDFEIEPSIETASGVIENTCRGFVEVVEPTNFRLFLKIGKRGLDQCVLTPD